MRTTQVASGSMDSAQDTGMNISLTRHAWFALCWCLVTAGTAWAQVDVVTVTKEDPICSDTDDPSIELPLNVCSIFVHLEEPGIKLISVASADITTDAPAGFFQHLFNAAVIAPTCSFVSLFPSLVCDSFITIDYDCGPDPGGTDATAPDGDFDAAEFALNGHVVGGWFNANPETVQGFPDENGDVLVAQLAVTDGFDISGSFTAYVLGDFGGKPIDCPDFDENQQVDAADLAFLLGAWGACPECAVDLNGDGTVNAIDLALLLSVWGPCGKAKFPLEAFELEFSCFGSGCEIDQDCDDDDPCTVDTCIERGCDNSPTDCNDNRIPDCDEIAEEITADCNGNSIPDECELGVKVHYVDDGGDSGNGCTCWSDACPDLQTALALAKPGEQIWVADGTYRPAPSVEDREATFQLLDGVALYGGFAGFEGTLAERAGLFDQTVLSGDLDGNDNPEDFPGGDSYDDNSYHVVTGSGTGSTAIIDGFQITGGNADGDFPHIEGGGLYNEMGAPTVANCLLRGNSAQYGGAVANTDNSSPTITDCIISGNSAVIYGGGIFNISGSDPTIEDCTFNGNSADLGGAMYNGACSPTVTDCVFADNSANDVGGGMVNWNGSISHVVGCAFVGNSAGTRGGGMFNQLTGAPKIIDCLFSVNTAGSGGGVYNWDSSTIISQCRFLGNVASTSNGGGVYNLGGSPIVLNSLLVGNSANFVGGGMYNGNSIVAVANCAFSGNSATRLEGGGMFNASNAEATLTNCTFSRNMAEGSGGGVYSASGSDATLTNCILWANIVDRVADPAAQIDDDGTGTTIVNYCDVQGGWAGAGGTANLDTDPLFADADGPDNIIGTADDNLRPMPGSPVLDAAVNSAVPPDISDLDDDGNTEEQLPFDLNDGNRFIDSPAAPDCPQLDGDCGVAPIVDMGAYELGADCNDNGIPDDIDIENETSDDCNGDGVPDECEIPPIGPPENDCNENGTPDECDIADLTSPDCNDNEIPDECELPVSSGGLCEEDCASDCDDNGVIDTCDIADCAPNDPACDDCNLNSVLDNCDVDPLDPDGDGHSSNDADEDGVPDECASAQSDGDWSADIWNLQGENPYPDNQQGVADQAVTLDGFSVFLDVDAEVPALRVINAATLDVTQDGESGDLTIADTAGVFDGNLLIEGTLNIGGERVIEAAGTVTIGTDGVYKSILGFEGAPSGEMMTDEIVVECGGTLTLGGSMHLATDGNITLQSNEDDDKGDCTPPDFEAGDDSTAAVGGDFRIQGPADIDYHSSQPLVLGGDFHNNSTNAEIFDWNAGAIQLDGSLHTIEAAGENRGPWPAGLVDNFAIGTLTLAPGSFVQLIDAFDNQEDGATACDEALYVELLEVGTGATLLTEGCPLYYNQLINNGSILDLGIHVLQILEPVAADFNGDGNVDAFDLAVLLGNWGDCPEPCSPGEPVGTCPTDLDGNCATEAFDLALLLGSWGPA